MKHTSKSSLYIISSLTITTIISGLILSSASVSADNDSVVDEINITVPVSCTLSGTGMDTHNANINNGLYVPDIGTTTLHAFCNDNEGFAIYAAGYTGNEIGGQNSNKLVGTTASNNATIESGIATTAGNPDISNWAMKLTTVSSPTPTYPITLDNGFGSYSAVPNSYTKVAHRDSSTDIGVDAEGATLTTTYAAYISKTQPADIYTGQVIYTLVHPSDAEAPLSPQQATAGCINYFANASTAVGTMGCQSATDNASVELLASNFSRTGYGFAGWSDAYDYATNLSAHFYGPSETITAPVGTTANGLSLYAVWVKSAGNLQDTSKVANVCNSLTTAPTDGTANLTSVSAFTDQRDNNTYAIAKLADGNCWMIENLRLENTGTDNANGSLAQGYGGQFAGLADPEPAWADNLTAANSLYYSGTQDGTATIDIGTSNASRRFPRYNHDNTNSRVSTPTANTVAMYSYGNYYTWAAAIADTTAYSSGDHNTTSICPTGWKIPLGNTSTGDIEQGASDAANRVTSFSYLDRKMGGTGASQFTSASLRWRKYPVNFVYSGYVYSGSVSLRGSYGYYWSSTANSSFNTYYLHLLSSSVYPGTSSNGGNKYYGRAVRCVAPGA